MYFWNVFNFFMLTYYLRTWLIIVLYWYIVLYIDVVFLFFHSVPFILALYSLLYLCPVCCFYWLHDTLWYSSTIFWLSPFLQWTPWLLPIPSHHQNSCNKSLWACVRLSEYSIQNPSGWVLKLKKKKSNKSKSCHFAFQHGYTRWSNLSYHTP